MLKVCYIRLVDHCYSLLLITPVRLKSTLDGSVIIEDGEKEVIIGEGGLLDLHLNKINQQILIIIYMFGHIRSCNRVKLIV